MSCKPGVRVSKPGRDLSALPQKVLSKVKQSWGEPLVKPPRVNFQAEQELVCKAIFGSPWETTVGDGLVQANVSSGGGEAETLLGAFTYCILQASSYQATRANSTLWLQSVTIWPGREFLWCLLDSYRSVIVMAGNLKETPPKHPPCFLSLNDSLQHINVLHHTLLTRNGVSPTRCHPSYTQLEFQKGEAMIWLSWQRGESVSSMWQPRWSSTW